MKSILILAILIAILSFVQSVSAGIEPVIGGDIIQLYDVVLPLVIGG